MWLRVEHVRLSMLSLEMIPSFTPLDLDAYIAEKQQS
jgi:hypothetical protein